MSCICLYIHVAIIMYTAEVKMSFEMALPFLHDCIYLQYISRHAQIQ